MRDSCPFFCCRITALSGPVPVTTDSNAVGSVDSFNSLALTKRNRASDESVAHPLQVEARHTADQHSRAGRTKVGTTAQTEHTRPCSTGATSTRRLRASRDGDILSADAVLHVHNADVLRYTAAARLRVVHDDAVKRWRRIGHQECRLRKARLRTTEKPVKCSVAHLADGKSINNDDALVCSGSCAANVITLAQSIVNNAAAPSGSTQSSR